MIFITETGSIYEVNITERKIRRCTNLNGRAASGRQGDNEWRPYCSLSEIKVGDAVLITWDKTTTPLLEGSPDFAVPATITSLVVEVKHDESSN